MAAEDEGRHWGYVQLVRRYTIQGLRRSERHLLAHIVEHEEKLRRSLERGDSYPVRHLEAELRNFREQLEIVRQELRRREGNQDGPPEDEDRSTGRGVRE